MTPHKQLSVDFDTGIWNFQGIIGKNRNIMFRSQIKIRWFLTGCFLAAASFSDIQALPLDEVLKAARDHNLQLQQERYNVISQREDILEARAEYLPTIQFQASIRSSNREAELRSDTLFDEATTPKSASLSISQTLYDGGRRDLNYSRATIGYRAGKSNFEDTVRSVTEDVIELYLQGIAINSIITAREETFTALEALLQANTRRASAGEGTRIEIAQTRARLSEAEANLIAARQQLSLILEQLHVETGIIIGDFDQVEIPDLDDTTLAIVKLRILENSPALDSAGYNRHATRVDLAITSRLGMPTIGLTGQASTFRESTPTIDRDDELSVGLELNMPIYSGGLIDSRKRRASSTYKTADLAYEDLANRLQLYATSLWSRRQSSMAMLAARSEGLRAAEEALTGLEEGMKAGLVSNVDVLDALDDKAAAQIALIETNTDFDIATLLIMLNTGILEL